MKHFNFRLAVINVCLVLVPSELLLSTHLPTSEGWTAELTVGLWEVVLTTGFEPTRVDPTHNTGFLSSIPPCVTLKNVIGEEGDGNHLMNSTSLEKSQSPVSGFYDARNREC